MEERVFGFITLVLIFISLFAFFGLLSSYGLFENVKSYFTGKQVFLDNDFNQPVSSFKPGNKGVLLSPNESDCDINKVSWGSDYAKVGGIVQMYVYGVNCNSMNITVEVHEEDLFFDDYVAPFDGEFVKGNASIDWIILEDVSESFENDQLEFYFNVLTDERRSALLLVSEEDALLQPPILDFRERILFWIVVMVLVAGIIGVTSSIISSFGKNKNNSY